MEVDLKEIVNVQDYPLDSSNLIDKARCQLQDYSAVLLPNFLQSDALESLVKEAESISNLAYRRHTTHSIYLKQNNETFPPDHIFNRQVITSKGCVTTDQIPQNSYLKQLYYNEKFQMLIKRILDIDQLYDYKDPLSSITIHYSDENQELGWHFDNSAFAITLLLQKPKAGGVFEYIPNIRVEDSSDFGFADDIKPQCVEEVTQILDGKMEPKRLDLEPGTLVLFRGRDSLHRVSKVVGDQQRILVVLAYNEVPNVRLPDKTMMTFFGRIA
jgi:hypothetical protein